MSGETVNDPHTTAMDQIEYADVLNVFNMLDVMAYQYRKHPMARREYEKVGKRLEEERHKLEQLKRTNRDKVRLHNLYRLTCLHKSSIHQPEERTHTAMGCDIHVWVETRRKDRSGDGWHPWEIMTQGEFFVRRDYTLFAFLARQRSYDNIKPVVAPPDW